VKVQPGPGRLVLLGHPLGHSLSPLFQNAALRAADIPVLYELLDVPRSALEETLAELRRQRAAGNVTIPYKEAAFAACDRLTETARAVGAVNTFWTSIDGAFVGDNTDVGGFQAAVEQLIGVDAAARAQRVALLGAGGAAAAVLHAMEGWSKARVRLYSRTRARAEQLVQRFRISADVVSSAAEAVADATLVVNATPIGLRDEQLPLPLESLPEGAAVLDLAYRIGETALVRGARTRGHRAMDGLTMLVEQGALSFERWFGVTADRNAMWDAIRQRSFRS
jgi:shikimate dehydrogenase